MAKSSYDFILSALLSCLLLLSWADSKPVSQHLTSAHTHPHPVIGHGRDDILIRGSTMHFFLTHVISCARETNIYRVQCFEEQCNTAAHVVITSSFLKTTATIRAFYESVWSFQIFSLSITLPWAKNSIGFDYTVLTGRVVMPHWRLNLIFAHFTKERIS